MSTLGERIKAARKKAGFSQKELSELTNISAAMLGHYETGYRCPKFNTLAKITDALQIDIEAILTDDNGKFDDQAINVVNSIIDPGDAREKLAHIGWVATFGATSQKIPGAEIGTDWQLDNNDGLSFIATNEDLIAWDQEVNSYALYKLLELMKKKTGES